MKASCFDFVSAAIMIPTLAISPRTLGTQSLRILEPFPVPLLALGGAQIPAAFDGCTPTEPTTHLQRQNVPPLPRHLILRMDALTLRPAAAPLLVSAPLVLSHRDIAAPYLECTYILSTVHCRDSPRRMRHGRVHILYRLHRKSPGGRLLRRHRFVRLGHPSNNTSGQTMTQPCSGSRSIA